MKYTAGQKCSNFASIEVRLEKNPNIFTKPKKWRLGWKKKTHTLIANSPGSLAPSLHSDS